MRKLPVVALSAARPYGEHQGFPDRAAANQKCDTPIRCGTKVYTRRELKAHLVSWRAEKVTIMRQERPACCDRASARARAADPLGVCNCERVNTFHSGNNEALSKSFVITAVSVPTGSLPSLAAGAVNGILLERHLAGDYEMPIRQTTSNKAISLKSFN